MLEKLIQFDTELFLFLNSFNSPFWDKVMWIISDTKTWIPLYLLVLFFVFKKNKTKGFITLFFMIALIFIADQSSVLFFKNTFQRFRPCHNEAISNLVHIVNNKCGGLYGFVSSHATNTFAFAIFTALFFNKRYIYYLLFFWAFIVSYSRIYLGVHYPADIICGAILGLFIGFLIYKFYDFSLKKLFIKK
ncbi:MAG: phosphatase PAP2 family protein [Bacteroidales bacterium]|nr:phosphatase PAP2 family protein [Bacteroidales bacterium]MBN2758771.1 phosphatase PAP2 family protein [Bacteroidales bacterium]